MLSYIVGLLACLLVFYNPLSQLLNLSPSAPPQIRRTPRPRVDESLLALDDWRGNLSCPDDADSYRVHVFSKAPLVIYIESFLSRAERAHLLEISEPAFEPATITHDGGAATERDQTIRDSEVAVIPRTEVVRCIEARARAFQGWRGEQWIERLRTQRYRPGGHYNHHFDWSSSYGGWGRVSSFMVWVDGSSDDPEDTLQGGGTEFPLLRKAGLDERWCRFIECGTTTTRAKKGVDDPPATEDKHSADAIEAKTQRTAEAKAGDDAGSGFAGEGKEEAAEAEDKVVFKPLAGNAVYWENFKPDGTGRGWDEAWHAGLPVIRGTKVGLNIWTWGRID